MRVEDPLERDIETAFVKYVHQRCGGITRKMNGLGFNSWPDRECLKLGVIRPLWMELKRLGEEPTAGQWEIIKDLRRRRQKVVVCDTLAKAKKAYDDHHD